jgi:hypothetical protein
MTPAERKKTRKGSESPESTTSDAEIGLPQQLPMLKTTSTRRRILITLHRENGVEDKEAEKEVGAEVIDPRIIHELQCTEVRSTYDLAV